MARNSSICKTSGSAARRLVSVLLVCVLPAGAAAIIFVWAMIQPAHVVTGMIRIVPVIHSMLTGEAEPDETGNYPQFVATQALLVTTNEGQLQKVVDDLAGRNLAFFNGQPNSRIEKLLAKALPKDANNLPDQILKNAITDGVVSAAYVPNSELMAVTMKSPNLEEARIIVNSFLRNYVGQYGVMETIHESQSIMVLEDKKNEIQRRIAECRSKIRDLTAEYGTTVFDPQREIEMARRKLLQSELAQLEMMKIKAEADIGVYEKMERLELPPEQLLETRTAFINTDPVVKELSARLVQVELDLTVAGQTQPPADSATPQKGSTLEILQQKLAEKRLALAKEFDSDMENAQKKKPQGSVWLKRRPRRPRSTLRSTQFDRF